MYESLIELHRATRQVVAIGLPVSLIRVVVILAGAGRVPVPAVRARATARADEPGGDRSGGTTDTR